MNVSLYCEGYYSMCETFVFVYEVGDSKKEEEIVRAYNTARALKMDSSFQGMFVGVKGLKESRRDSIVIDAALTEGVETLTVESNKLLAVVRKV